MTSVAPHSGHSGLGSDMRISFSNLLEQDSQTYSYSGTAPPLVESRYRCAHDPWQDARLSFAEPPIELTAPLLILPLGLLIWGCIPALAGVAVQASDTGEHFQLARKTIAVVAREGAVRSLVRLLKPFGRDGDPVRTEVSEVRSGALPVLLIPSPPANRAAMTFLATFLTHRGLPWVHSVNVSKGTTLDAQATDLAEKAAKLAKAAGVDKIDVVAHGISGLAAAWWIRHLGGDAHVRRLITIGTPWSGTRMAVFQRGTLARTLLPGAAILDDLVPKNVPTIAIGSPTDPFVVPSASAHPEGAVAVVLDGAGHTDLLISARAFRAVFTALSEPMGDSSPAEVS